MTTRELIERLQELDPDGTARVMYYTPTYEELTDYDPPGALTRVKAQGGGRWYVEAEPRYQHNIFLAVIL